MGAKITIDSATLANKGLEVIEAHWLYDVDYDAIEVVIHPQSVVHSAVRFVDGSLKAQLGTPDMRLPIQYALTYPDRRPSPAAPPDLIATGRLDFRAPDETRFPALRIAREAGRAGPRASAALIAADEVAVARFLDGHARLRRASRACSRRPSSGSAEPARADPDVEELVALDAEVRAAFATGPIRRRRVTGVPPVDHHDRPVHLHPRRARGHPRARPLRHRPAGQRARPRVRHRLPAAREGPARTRARRSTRSTGCRSAASSSSRARTATTPTTRARSRARACLTKLIDPASRASLMNILLAFVIFTGIAWLASPARRRQVRRGPAGLAGRRRPASRPGEAIVAVDGERYQFIAGPTILDGLAARRRRDGRR